MKILAQLFRIPVVPAVVALAVLFVPDALASGLLYICGMHPQILKREPGDCPVCGMKLTPVSPGGAAASGVGGIRVDAATVQRMNLKTAIVARGPVQREFRAVGAVAYNEVALRDITTKYEGWIEKLHVNATGVAVKAGDPLFEIYSPELYNALLNHVAVTKDGADANATLSSAVAARLRHYDVPADIVEQVRRTGEAPRTLLFRAPAAGVVVEKGVVSGQMIKPGERIFRLAGLDTVWVHAQVYEKDLPFVREGQAVTVHSSYEAGTVERGGIIQRILPQIEEQTRTATVRIELPNEDGALRPGMFVEVGFSTQLVRDAVLVPGMAVLRSGERNTVFVALEGGLFEPREVKLGARSAGDFYQVLGGLEAGERVVTSGQFMLDSESRLREAMQKMLREDAAPKPPLPVTAAGDRIDPALLGPVALAAADVAGALARDDFDAFKRHLPALQAALEKFLPAHAQVARGAMGAHKDALFAAVDLAAARRDFEPFSTALADLVLANRKALSGTFHVFECAMAPGLGKARWLQSVPGAKNPFYGSGMLRCGEEIELSASRDVP